MNNFLMRDLQCADTKRQYNIKHFQKAAVNYDRATRFLSLGNDCRWKDLLVSQIPQLESPRVLDLACGTGDLAFKVLNRFPTANVVGVDITPKMLEIARERASRLSVICSFEEGDISRLSYESHTFDLITAGYAFRNAPCLETTIASVASLLKQNGVLAILEFANSENKLLKAAQSTLLKYWGGLWGTLLDKDFASHSYIGTSLRLFPSQKSFIRLLSSQSLVLKQRTSLMFGSVEILIFQSCEDLRC
jgi:demethylmenaquinone methyltransferase/2-methoxy-6-polyprenyl-1,4-benzoquinol methylase